MLTALLLFLCTAWAQDTELRLWHAYRDQERQALEELVRHYDEQHPEVTVSLLALTHDAFVSRLEASAPRGNGPDLFISAHERIGFWVESGLVRELALPGPGEPSTGTLKWIY